MKDTLSRVAHWSRRFPLWVAYRRNRYRKQFPHWPGLFLGIHQSFEDAYRNAPTNLPKGYDSSGPASMYDERLQRVYSSDYPMLYWLNLLLSRDGTQVVDFGGHVGIAYYAYERFLDYPKDMKWTVVDVPAVVERGRRLAAEKKCDHQLRFTSDPKAAGPHHILIASGSPQYLESPDLFETIGATGTWPEHILLNRIPVHDRHTYVTLQNIGTAYCAYRIYRRKDLMDRLTALGYDVMDEWQSLEHQCLHPYDEEYSVPSYRGFYLSRA